MIKFVDEKYKSDVDILFGIYFEKIHVGNIKLGPIDWKNGEGEVSYIIGEKRFWGMGLAGMPQAIFRSNLDCWACGNAPGVFFVHNFGFWAGAHAPQGPLGLGPFGAELEWSSQSRLHIGPLGPCGRMFIVHGGVLYCTEMCAFIAWGVRCWSVSVEKAHLFEGLWRSQGPQSFAVKIFAECTPERGEIIEKRRYRGPESCSRTADRRSKS